MNRAGGQIRFNWGSLEYAVVSGEMRQRLLHVAPFFDSLTWRKQSPGSIHVYYRLDVGNLAISHNWWDAAKNVVTFMDNEHYVLPVAGQSVSIYVTVTLTNCLGLLPSTNEHNSVTGKDNHSSTRWCNSYHSMTTHWQPVGVTTHRRWQNIDNLDLSSAINDKEINTW